MSAFRVIRKMFKCSINLQLLVKWWNGGKQQLLGSNDLCRAQSCYDNIHLVDVTLAKKLKLCQM